MKRPLNLLVTLVLLCSSFAASAQKNYPSRFWEISGNGLTKPSYLYGTMHVSKKVAFNLPDTFFIALNNVDVVALETNPDITLDEMMGSKLFNLVNTNNGMTTVSQFYKNAFAFTVPDNRDYATLLSMNNDLVNQMMFRFSDMLRQSDFEESTFLDLFIYQSGKRLKKQVTGLETFDGAMKYFLKAVNPENNKKDEDSDSTQVDGEEEEDYDSYSNAGMVFSRIEDAYRAGDLDMLDSLSRKTYPNKLYGYYLIDQRNIVMADAMDSIMRKGALFAAVGSAHLPGTEGVIELLRKKGYTVRPISLEKGKNAQSTKEKIEGMRLPVEFSTYTADDNAFVVDVPEKMYAVNLFGETKQYLALNSENAAFYTIYRVKTYDGITGYTPEKNQKRFDSLFYENIPGKIIKKTVISRNGFPGYDIVARSQNGDIRRYHFYFTPLEVMVFEAAATGDYVQSKEIDRFFTSIQLNVPLSNELQPYRPEQGGYEVQLPPYRIYDSKIPMLRNTRNGEVAMAGDAKGNTYFLFRNFLQDIDYIEEDTFELAYLTEMFNRKLKYETVSRAFTTQDRHPALESVLKSPEGRFLFVKTVINGQHYYLQAVHAPDSTYPQAYFSSLKFIPHAYEGNGETYTDTSMHYSVQTHIKPLEEQVIEYASYNSLQNNYSYDYYDEEPKPYEFIHKSSTYINMQNMEQIDVLYEKIHDYYYAWDVDSFWNEEVKYMSSRNGMLASNKQLKTGNGLNSCEFTATDTNSTRGILTRIIQQGGRMYYLRTVIDTIDGPSPWVREFFQSFRPADTVIGLDPFTPKYQQFFTNLEGTDSLKNREAADVADYIDLVDSVAPQLAKFLDSENYYRYNQEDRESLIASLGYLKHPVVLPVLQKLYTKAGDTSALHFTILRAMSYQRNAEAAAAIKKILVEDSPLPSYNYELSQVFYPWYDTLELVANWFPDMLDVAGLDEYRSHVYGLLATLVDSGKIKPAAYQESLNKILVEANQTLKRYNSKEQKNTAARLAEEADEDAGRESSYHATVNIGEETGELKDFMSILMPHYAQPNVKNFFDKLGKVKDDDMLIQIYSREAANKIPVPDTVWDHYARDVDWRVILYNALEQQGQLDKFPPTYKTQDALAQSILKNDGYTGKKDTITLLERVKVFTRDDSGWVYFYKCYYGREKKYYFDYVGLQPLEETKLNTRFYDEDGEEVDYHSNGVKWKESKIAELKQDVLEKYRLFGRQRVSIDDYNFADELGAMLGEDEDY